MAITDQLRPESKLRQAMSAAADVVDGFKQRRNGGEGELVLTEEMIDRRPLDRVKVKVGVLQYIDSIFQNRTKTDGVILATRRERLVEELTNLVLNLDEAETNKLLPPAKPASDYGRPVTDNN